MCITHSSQDHSNPSTIKNKRISTRGVAIQIMKHAHISRALFRDDMVKKWQRIEESSGNTLASHFFVAVGRGSYLGATSMTKIFQGQNHFLHSTKMKLVHNLCDITNTLISRMNTSHFLMNTIYIGCYKHVINKVMCLYKMP
jgi:hypothetical protein